MTKKQYNSLGYAVSFEVAESPEEFDKSAGRVGACMESANNDIVYRATMPVFRDVLLHGCEAHDNWPKIDGIEQVTGVKRKTATKQLLTKNEDGSFKTTEIYDEKESVYEARALSESGKTKADFQPTAELIASLIAFDASERARATAGPKKIGKAYLEKATELQNAGQLETVAAKLAKKLKREVAATVESVAVAIKEFQDAEAAKAIASLS